MAPSVMISLLTLALAIAPALASPTPQLHPAATPHFNSTLHKRNIHGPKNPGVDFPDPGLFKHPTTGNYWAYATSANGYRIPVAKSSDFANWEVLGEALNPTLDGYDQGIWAPEVVRYGEGNYLMYYSIRKNDGHRCIGFATATKAAGPFTPTIYDLVCSPDNVDVIDPAVLYDSATGTGYLVWSRGTVKDTNPEKPTAIQMQKLGKNGQSVEGQVYTLFEAEDGDQGTVEAPATIVKDGWYYVLFSSAYFGDINYDISYAVARNPTGPYTKVGAPDAPLLQTPRDSNGNPIQPLGPGGASAWTDSAGSRIVYHALSDDKQHRYLWTANNLCVGNGVIKIKC